ncbi:MAG: hypothetical protein OXU20_10515 [Myxococcales bacterium]|nr:hypothetical protein [Myxococcales bacterium]
MTTQRSGFAAAAILGVAVVGLLIWLVSASGPSDAPQAMGPEEGASEALVAPPVRPTPPVATGNKAAAKDAPAEAPAQPPSRGENDLFAGEMPDFMAELHIRVIDGKRLSASHQKSLYEWGQEHKDDARPQLLLAWDSMNRDWDGIAVRLYRMAFRADPRAKEDPTMLRDLLKVLASHDHVEYREASEIIEEAFGADALPNVEERIEAMRTAGKPDSVRRLEKLKERLSG